MKKDETSFYTKSIKDFKDYIKIESKENKYYQKMYKEAKTKEEKENWRIIVIKSNLHIYNAKQIIKRYTLKLESLK